MKPSFSLIFVVLLAIQAFSVSSTGSRLDALFAGEETNTLPHQRTIQVLFNLPTIVTGFLEYQDTLNSISELIGYYLNAPLFENLMYDFFRYTDSDKNGVITQQEYQQTINAAGIDREGADRVYALAALDNPSREMGFGDFKIAMELFFAESMSQVTFAYITENPAQSHNVGIKLEDLVRGIQAIFDDIPENYPNPGCDQLQYLFLEFDRDCDEKLNPEEFHHVFAIFFRYYKTGLENYRFAKLIHRDDVFSLLWEKQNAEANQRIRIESMFTATSDYFLLATFEKILNSVGHDIFQIIDKNGNGIIEFEEFKTLLQMFSAPESEAQLLYTTADTDHNGSVDYGEFLVTFETFVRRALSSLIFNIIKLNGNDVNRELCAQAWKNITSEYGVSTGLTDDGYNALFDTLDINGDKVLDSTEFAQYSSTILTTLKKKLREDIDARISAVSGLNATARTIDSLNQESVGEGEGNTDISVAQGIVARIVSRVSVTQSQVTEEVVELLESSFEARSSAYGDFDEGVQKRFGFIDSGIAPGANGFGFSLYEAVQQSIEASGMDKLPEPESNKDSKNGPAFGILLQEGSLKNVGKAEL